MGVVQQLPTQRILTPGSFGVTFQHVGGAANWWDPNNDGLCILAAYQPKGAASQAASYTDLSGNGNDASVGVAPTWDAVNGWTFNGSSQYLDTNLQPASTWSMLMQGTTSGSPQGYAGCITTGVTTRFYFTFCATGNTHRYGVGNGAEISEAGCVASGNLAIASINTYLDGVAETVGSGSWASNGLSVVIGAIRVNAGLIYGGGSTQAFAIYNCTLTAPQVSAVATAMAAL